MAFIILIYCHELWSYNDKPTVYLGHDTRREILGFKVQKIFEVLIHSWTDARPDVKYAHGVDFFLNNVPVISYSRTIAFIHRPENNIVFTCVA